MFRATIRNLNVSNRICSANNFNIGQCELNVQSVRRWRYRRPLELGTSKSKLFFIPERPPKDKEETEEMNRLHKRYQYVSFSFPIQIHIEVHCIYSLNYFHSKNLEYKWHRCETFSQKRNVNVMQL